VDYLILPGLGNSGPEHWQTHWEKIFSARRVMQNDWENPQLQDWLVELDQKIEACTEPVCLIAHSLGVALVAHWGMTRKNEKVRAAFLVAPSDVDSPDNTPESVRNFAPMPLQLLPFKTTVVASRNDPFISVSRAELFAKSWGATFADIGNLGHINADSQLGDWPQGQRLLESLLQ
jgi:uncharacterized protein